MNCALLCDSMEGKCEASNCFTHARAASCDVVVLIIIAPHYLHTCHHQYSSWTSMWRLSAWLFPSFTGMRKMCAVTSWLSVAQNPCILLLAGTCNLSAMCIGFELFPRLQINKCMRVCLRVHSLHGKRGTSIQTCVLRYAHRFYYRKNAS